jgi:hypothetical protein
LLRAHEIAVFGAAAYAGEHTNTVRVDTEVATHHVDTGLIVFNGRNYPKLTRGVSDGLDSNTTAVPRTGCSRTARTSGHCFNPVSFVYCHDGEDQLQAVSPR